MRLEKRGTNHHLKEMETTVRLAQQLYVGIANKKGIGKNTAGLD
jgi:hypothetical protein